MYTRAVSEMDIVFCICIVVWHPCKSYKAVVSFEFTRNKLTQAHMTTTRSNARP